ncbi:MAG: 23S rRNA pseudouridine(955/2504/2580) synthase [Candidatus Westeberhardia cardiocondylae]|nr:23S rRNA pseudouridine(955/2504/2580) synthase [Candidatus Westeberhardia cardiocondylae]
MKKQIYLKLHIITITKNNALQRIDNFLFQYFKTVPKNMIYRIIRKGKVRINKKRVKHNYKLQKNDIVRIPPVKIEKIRKNFFKKISFHKFILYENKELIVINKPTGMAVHGGSGLKYGIIEMLKFYYKKTNFLKLVHRLDRDTSGILLIAKKNSILRKLHDLMQKKEINKKYLALVKGKWSSKIKNITIPLFKKRLENGKRIVQINQKYGKYSKTLFKVKENFSSFATLVKAKLITGRTHQIRVHAKYAGHPIAYDALYGDKEFNLKLKNFGIDRLFLHAYSLSFQYPNTNEIFSITAPLDKHLSQCLKKLRSNNNKLNV